MTGSITLRMEPVYANDRAIEINHNTVVLQDTQQ